MVNRQTYFDYYDRAIQTGLKGIKLVLGGTGLGKTSAIVDVIKSSNAGDRKFMYCANRLQLLNEMAESLEQKGIPYAYLRSDADVVVSILRISKLRNKLYELIDSPFFIGEVEKSSAGSGWRKLDLAKLRQACETIERIGDPLDNIRGDVLEQLVQDQVRVIMSFFRNLLQEIKQRDLRTHQDLLTQPIVQELFPYIRFMQTPDVRVLLVTVQKAYLGFFDGQENINLTKLNGRNGNHIIFLDEYDFLENELINLICNSEQLTRPFRFVEFFYNAMMRHKLPAAEYPVLPGATSELRQRLENIMGIIAELRSEGIQFPEINQFTCQVDDKKGFIFQTSHTLIMDSLYLRQTDRSYEIVRSPEDSNIPALKLFRLVRRAMAQILFLFKELEAQAPTVYQELLRQCYQDTDYFRSIGRINQLPRQSNLQVTRFDSLLEEGFGLYEITELNQETDPDEVEFNYMTIYTTPERILSSVARSNLVFGLSATADIPRLVRNFNEDWLRKQNDVHCFDIEHEDIEIIHALNTEKQKKRANRVRVLQGKTLDDFKREDIKRFILAVAKDQGFGGDDANGARRGRVEAFFATLHYIIESRTAEELSTDTHLLFFNTFRQIKHIFNSYKRLSGDLFTIAPVHSDILFDTFEIEFEGTRFIVVFYDADQAKNIQSSERAKESYDQLFWHGLPVLVITQYPSAGNGVNLQYYPTPESKERKANTDFRNIHLLEAPYFYFGRHDAKLTIEENRAVIKENIWYLAKLYEGQVISRDEFEKSLRSIHFDNLNARYHNEWATKGSESVYNRMAALIQALGRIERVWRALPDQTVVLSKDVWQVFELFCTRPQFAEVFENRMPIISSNLQEIFAQIAQQAKVNERWVQRYKDEMLAVKNQQSKDKVGTLLQRLIKFRTGSGDDEAKQHWLALREAALKHDLHTDILKQYSCLFKAEYDHYRNGTLYINDALDILPFDRPFGDGVKPWHLDSVYWHIASNSLLRRFFEQHDYQMGFSSTSQQFFTPYFYQAILVGAIGEAAIRAILTAQGIGLDDSLPDELFELADLKIANHAWYIDCKNYSDRTLENFHVQPDDPAWRPKLNDDDFKTVAQYKLAAIRAVHGHKTNCKLMYLNLASSENWRRIYFDADFHEVRSFDAAEIIVIPGILNRDVPEDYTEMYLRFIDHLLNAIK